MPILAAASAGGGTGYGNVFLGKPGPTFEVKVDLSGLTTAEVDPAGYLKPGVPFDITGSSPNQLATLVGSSGIVRGVVPEATRLNLTTIPPTNTTLGTETGDHFVALVQSGIVIRDVGENNLGRAYTANEIAGFDLAGSQLRLTTT